MLQVTVSFTLSVPGRLARFMALSKEERRAVYRGWWQTTKKEAHHYWVTFLAYPAVVCIFVCISVSIANQTGLGHKEVHRC